MNAQATDNPNRALALALAAAGVPVFPCLEADGTDGSNKKAKAPYTQTGSRTPPPTAIKSSVVVHWPNAVPGIPTGAASGLAVIDCDIDRTTGETIGEDQVAELELDHPDAVHVRTQSGGLHIAYAYFDGVRGSAKKDRQQYRRARRGRLHRRAGCPDGKRCGVPLRGSEPARCPAGGRPAGVSGQAVRAAIDARKGRASKGGKRQADDQKTSGAKATEEETIEVLRILLAEAPNTLDRTDWVKLALSLRDAFGETMRDDFMGFSLRYKGETPCTPEAVEKVWDSAHTAAEINGPGTALYLLKGAVGKFRYKAVWQEVFSRTRGDGADEFDLSHDALSLALGRDSFDLDARYVASFGAKGWLFWTVTRWEQDASLQHMTRVRDYLRARANSLLAWAEEHDDGEGNLINWAKRKGEMLRNKTTVAAVELLARSNPATAASADAFDADVMLLGTPGGTVDLRTGELREARREDLDHETDRRRACARGHAARAVAQLPERGLRRRPGGGGVHAAGGGLRAHRPDDGAQAPVPLRHRPERQVARSSTPSSWILNDYARRAAAETFLNSVGEKHATGLAGLQGARLVVGSELPAGKTWDEAVIKDLTGGDVVSARFMRGDFFDFKPQLTLMIAGNNQPSFRGVDEALRARVVLVPFTVTIPPEKRDPDLGEKLKAEAPGNPPLGYRGGAGMAKARPRRPGEARGRVAGVHGRRGHRGPVPERRDSTGPERLRDDDQVAREVRRVAQ
jgi:putative DNA primase/helicase